MKTTHGERRISVTRQERIDEAGTIGFRSVPDGELIGTIEVEIDWPRMLAYMGDRALRSRGKKCVDGFVTVRARNVRKVMP